MKLRDRNARLHAIAISLAPRARLIKKSCFTLALFQTIAIYYKIFRAETIFARIVRDQKIKTFSVFAKNFRQIFIYLLRSRYSRL
jgi:hypothetical protein